MKRLLAVLCLLVTFATLPLQLLAAPVCSEAIRRVPCEERVIALTFDDGPHPKYTDRILDVLAEYGAKATFFVVGENLELYGEATLRAVAEGHEIGNHTYAHPALAALCQSELENQILHNETVIKEKAQSETALFRPPEGYCSACVKSTTEALGYRVILWDVDTRDWAGTPSDTIVKNVMKNAKPGSILLFHDYVSHKSTTIDALKQILPRLQAQGYRFVTVSELLSYSCSG